MSSNGISAVSRKILNFKSLSRLLMFIKFECTTIYYSMLAGSQRYFSFRIMTSQFNEKTFNQPSNVYFFSYFNNLWINLTVSRNRTIFWKSVSGVSYFPPKPVLIHRRCICHTIFRFLFIRIVKQLSTLLGIRDSPLLNFIFQIGDSGVSTLICFGGLRLAAITISYTNVKWPY